MTQLSNVLIIDNSAHYQNELSVIKTFNNWVIFKADVWAINLLLLCHEKKKWNSYQDLYLMVQNQKMLRLSNK